MSFLADAGELIRYKYFFKKCHLAVIVGRLAELDIFWPSFLVIGYE